MQTKRHISPARPIIARAAGRSLRQYDVPDDQTWHLEGVVSIRLRRPSAGHRTASHRCGSHLHASKAGCGARHGGAAAGFAAVGTCATVVRRCRYGIVWRQEQQFRWRGAFV